MCSWLSGALFNLGHVMPFNPADTEQLALNARDVDGRIRQLAHIAAELGWHADADLDRAWALIQEYEQLPPHPVASPRLPVSVATDRTEDIMGETAQTVQWCPDGNPLNGIPGEVCLLLAEDHLTHGYGYGDGWTMIFGTARGDIEVQPGQWVVRHPDGHITVEDERPPDAELFDAARHLAEIKAAKHMDGHANA